MTLKDDLAKLSADLKMLQRSVTEVTTTLDTITANMEVKSRAQAQARGMLQQPVSWQPQPQPPSGPPRQRFAPPPSPQQPGLTPQQPMPQQPTQLPQHLTLGQPQAQPVPLERGSDQQPWWQNEHIVTRILAAAGAFITVAGIAFLVALAIQAGMLGPLGRVILACALAVLLFGTAVWVHRSQRSNPGVNGLLFSSYLTATLTVLSLVDILDWWPWHLGQSTQIILTFGFLALCRLWEKPFLTIALLVPGYISLANMAAPSWALASVALISAVSVGLAWERNWPWIAPFSSSALFAVAAAASGVENDHTVRHMRASGLPKEFMGGFEVGAFSLILAASAILTLLYFQPPFNEEEFKSAPGIFDGKRDIALRRFAACVLPATILVVAGNTAVQQIDFYIWATALLTLSAIGFSMYRYQPQNSAQLLMYVEFSSLIALYLFLIVRPEAGLTWIGIATSIVLLVGHRYRPRIVPAILPAAAVVGVIIDSADMVRLAWKFGYQSGQHAVALDKLNSVEPMVSALLLAALALCLLGMLSFKEAGQKADRINIAGAAVGLWLSSTPIVLLTTAVGRGMSFSGSSAFLFGHTIVSVTWMMVAASLLLSRRWPLSESTTLAAGLVLAAAATGKLILFDMSALTGLARVLAFIVCGLLLLTMATWRSKQDRSALIVRDNGLKAPPQATISPQPKNLDEWAL